MNFQCKRSCVQNAKDKEKAAQEGEVAKNDEPKPFKVDDKVDYKPEGGISHIIFIFIFIYYFIYILFNLYINL